VTRLWTPERRADPELRWIISYNLDLFARSLEAADRGEAMPLSEEAAPDLVASAARRASEGSGVESLLHDYQVGVGAIWRSAVDRAGFVYVTDSLNRRVQKFTANGAFVTAWGSEGAGNGV